MDMTDVFADDETQFVIRGNVINDVIPNAQATAAGLSVTLAPNEIMTIESPDEMPFVLLKIEFLVFGATDVVIELLGADDLPLPVQPAPVSKTNSSVAWPPTFGLGAFKFGVSVRLTVCLSVNDSFPSCIFVTETGNCRSHAQKQRFF